MHFSLAYSTAVSFHSYKIRSRSSSGKTSKTYSGVAGTLSNASTNCSNALSMYSQIRFGFIEATVCAANPNPSPKSSTDNVNG